MSDYKDNEFYTLLKNAKNVDGTGITTTQRWSPSIRKNDFTFSREMVSKLSSQRNDEIKSNFFYNFQYLEFLKLQVLELVLTPVLKAMIKKSYIITGVSIIELCFTVYLENLGHDPKESFYSKIKEVKDDNGKNFFNLSDNDFTDIDELRKSRNKIHLEDKKNTIDAITRHDMNKDYNYFDISDSHQIEMVKAILLKLFGTEKSKFTNKPELFRSLLSLD